jgi:activator of HSP90 ATPase
MAKWGEGDPRWICEERADATNVNNWHWTEKNAAKWSRDKLKELLVGLVIENDKYSVKFKSITKCDGEASANNRKSKLIFFYEWVINGEWEGVVKGEKQVYKGNYEVPNLSEEYEAHEVDVNITMKESKPFDLKEFARKEGEKKLREQFAKYITSLKEEFAQGIIKPTANTPLKDNNNTKPVQTPPQVKPAAAKLSAATDVSNGGVGVKIPTSSLTMHEEFKCRVAELYDCFVNVNMVRAFTQNGVDKYEPEKDGKFSLFGSNITGSFVSLTLNKRITMKWRNKRWPEGHDSIATLEFTEKTDCSEIKLTHMGIPKEYLENTEEGWKRFYWNAIRQTFGFGSGLF